jgi:hypothetical protein
MYRTDGVGHQRATVPVFQALRKLCLGFSHEGHQACCTNAQTRRATHPSGGYVRGKLFQVETEYLRGGVPSRVVSRKTRAWRRVEHYWLCDACSPFVTLTFDQGRGVITVPLPDGAGRKTAKVISMDDAVELTAFDDGPARRTLNEVRK